MALAAGLSFVDTQLTSSEGEPFILEINQNATKMQTSCG